MNTEMDNGASLPEKQGIAGERLRIAREVWLPVIGFEGFYVISDSGNIRSLPRIVKTKNRWGECVCHFPGVPLRPHMPKGGYLQVTLCGTAIRRQVPVHVVVAEAFIGPRPPGTNVCHKDGSRDNPRLDNLYYGTPKQNSGDAIKHGTQPRGEACGSAKLTAPEVIKIRRSFGISQRDLASQFGVCQSTIGFVSRGETWRHVV